MMADDASALTDRERILEHLRSNGPTKANDLAQALQLFPDEVGKILGAMKRAGEVERQGWKWSVPGAAKKHPAKKRASKRVSRGARKTRAAVDQAHAEETDFNFMIDSDGDLALCHRESGSDPVWIDGKSARRLRDFLNRADELLAA